jgi:membrane protease YdiL (CAAX protease family)
MLDLFENNHLKSKNVLLAIIILIVTSFGVVFPEILGSFSELFSWTYLALGGGSALALLVGYDKLKLFFRRMVKGSWKWILISIFLGFLVSVLFVLLGSVLNISIAENAGLEGVGEESLPLWIHLIVIITTFFSLAGEEIITAAMAVIVFYYARKRLNAKWSWLLSAVLSAILFGLMHYGVYDGNIFQCIFVIGLGRLPFTYAWRKTGSLWGGIWAHVIYDLIVIGLIYVSV